MAVGKVKRGLSLGSAIVEQYFFSGLLVGWASLVYILKEEGVYGDLCDASDVKDAVGMGRFNYVTNNNTFQLAGNCSVTCEKQDIRFNQIFVISITTYEIATAFYGLLFDTIGTGYTRIMITTLETLGLFFLFLVTPTEPWWIYPGMIIIAISGIMVLVTNMQVANLFPEKRSTVLTLLNGVYDSSSCTFMIFKVMYDRGWLGFHDIFMVLLIGTIFMWTRTFLLMPRRDTIPFPVPPHYRFGISDWCKCAKIGVLDGDDNSDLSLGAPRGSDSSFIYQRSLRDQWDSTLELAKSTSFISFNIWFIACNLRHVFFVSSVNAWLSRMPGSDCAYVSQWTNFFGVAQFFGFAFAPIAGLFIDTLEEYFNRSISIAQRQEYVTSCGVSLVVTTVIGIIFTVCALEELVAAALILEVVFRAFLYGCHATFIALLFPNENFGFLYGISFFVGGVSGFLAIPMFELAMGSNLQGNFLLIDCFFIIFLGISTVWAAIMHIRLI